MKKIFLTSLFLFFILFNISFASDVDIDILKLDTQTLKSGYTINGFSGGFRVGIFPEVLSVETNVTLKDFHNTNSVLPIPADKEIVSSIYEFDISNKAAFKDEKPVIIEIKYDSDYIGFRSIYFWDGGKRRWVKIPSFDITGRKKMRANLHLPYARLAILEDRNAMETGTASWYKWKDCDCAASPDYPKGTRLRVTNLDNGKSVVVTVNDYGPERDKFPNRVIDLDLVAFNKIANPALGLCNVRVVEEVVDDKKISLLGADNLDSSDIGDVVGSDDDNIDVELDAESVMVINAKTGKILFEKDSEKVMPIASITKLMTANVILDLNIDFDKVMEYSVYDDDVTDYAKKQEMTYLYVNPGDTMTVKDLFFSSLLGSANNATYTLYRSTGLLRRYFVEVMNRKAIEIGMDSTVFADPSGLNGKNVSTARDLAKLGRKIFNNMRVLQATTSKRYGFSTINNNEMHSVRNRNKLLDSDLYILGAKTGYLHEAGHCIMFKAVDLNKNEIIVVALGNFSKNKDDYFDEAEQLALLGFEKMAD